MNSKANWVLQIDPQVLKALKHFPQKDKKRILSIINNLSADPYAGDLQKIKGEGNVWRRRVGSYRIFFEVYIQEKVIHIFHAERRTTTTY